jgi:hypothetical protein
VKIQRLSPDFTRRAGVDSALVKDNKYITKPLLTNVPYPSHPDLHWAMMPDGGIVVARSGDYSIRIFSPELKLLKEFRHPGARLRVTDDDKEKYFDGIVFSSGDNTRQGAPDFIRRETEFPEYKPYFKYILVDDAGYILIRTFESQAGSDLYDVFSSDGRFLGRLAIPPLSTSALFLDGRVYDILKSEEELPAVVRYRIR